MTHAASQPLLDAHCHIDLYPDRQQVVADAVAGQVVILGVTNRASEYRNARQALADQPNLVLGIGIHPEAAGSVYLRHELTLFEQSVHTTPLISEIGLDRRLADRGPQYFGDAPTMKAQTALLERILEHDLRGKTLSVHSRGASRQVADMLQAAGHSAIFHWYCDDLEDARYVAEKGFEFSVNPAMKDPRLGSPEVLRWIPAESLHLESDGPFVKWGDADMTPHHCREFISDLADLRNESEDDLTEQLSRNAARILKNLNYPIAWNHPTHSKEKQ